MKLVSKELELGRALGLLDIIRGTIDGEWPTPSDGVTVKLSPSMIKKIREVTGE